jgi:gas vesicle protein
MSTKNFLFGFIGGIFAGALAALLLAPSSGDELRARIGTEAEHQRERAAAELERTLKSIQQTIDETSEQVKTLVEKSEAQTAEGSEEA